MTAGSADERLGEIYRALLGLGVDCLVMDGHAVRHYGIDRNTIDFDLVVALSVDNWDALPGLLQRSPVLVGAREGPSWRPRSFRRFVIGSLPDGRDERLEFWRQNHLLAPFSELFVRRSVGPCGSAEVAFLGLADLIRSKETERDDDWRDVRLLEEVGDDRRLRRDLDDEATIEALASLRSQRGFETALQRGLLRADDRARQALKRAVHPVSRAFLAPYAPAPSPVRADAEDSDAIVRLLAGPLRTVAGASARHLALVEAIRRLYQQQRMAEDRADKERQPPGA